jgi:hypothetical protein
MVAAAGTADLEERRQHDRAQVTAVPAQGVEHPADGGLAAGSPPRRAAASSRRRRSIALMCGEI